MKIELLVLNKDNILDGEKHEEMYRIWVVKGFYYSFIIANYDTYRKDLTKKISQIAERHGIGLKSKKPDDQRSFMARVIIRMLNYHITKNSSVPNKYFEIRKMLDGLDLHAITTEQFVSVIGSEAAEFIFKAHTDPPILPDIITVKGPSIVDGKKLGDAIAILTKIHTHPDHFYKAIGQCQIVDPSTSSVKNLIDYIVESDNNAYTLEGIFGYEQFVNSLFSFKATYRESRELARQRAERAIAGRDRKAQEAYRQAIREANYELRRGVMSAISTVASPVESVIKSHTLGRILYNMAAFSLRQVYLRTNRLFGLGGKRSYGPFDEGSVYYDPFGTRYKAETRSDARRMNALKQAWGVLRKHVPGEKAAKELVSKYMQLRSQTFNNPQMFVQGLSDLLIQYAPDAAGDPKKEKEIKNALEDIMQLQFRLSKPGLFGETRRYEEDEDDDLLDINRRQRYNLSRYTPEDEEDVEIDNDYSSRYSFSLPTSTSVASPRAVTGRDTQVSKISQEGPDIVSQMSNQAKAVPQQDTSKRAIPQLPKFAQPSQQPKAQPAQPAAGQTAQPGPNVYVQTPNVPIDILKCLCEYVSRIRQDTNTTDKDTATKAPANAPTSMPEHAYPLQAPPAIAPETDTQKPPVTPQKPESKEEPEQDTSIISQVENNIINAAPEQPVKDQKGVSKLPTQPPPPPPIGTDKDIIKQQRMQKRQAEKEARMMRRKRGRKKYAKPSEAQDTEGPEDKKRGLIRRAAKSIKEKVSKFTKTTKVGRAIAKTAGAVRNVVGAARAGMSVAGVGSTIARVGGILTRPLASFLGSGAGSLGAGAITNPFVLLPLLAIGGSAIYGLGKGLYKGVFRQLTGQKTFDLIGGPKKTETKLPERTTQEPVGIDLSKIDPEKIPSISSIKSSEFKLPSVTSSGKAFVNTLKTATGYSFGTTSGGVKSNITDRSVAPMAKISASQPLPTEPIRPSDYRPELREEPQKQSEQQIKAQIQAPKVQTQQPQEMPSAADLNKPMIEYMTKQAQINSIMAQQMEDVYNRIQVLQEKNRPDLSEHFKG